uniref:Mitochondrial transcription termination factor family protein n=1 Tax=Davidia involucrata TaxID=16924 RepID=A0A5B7AN15_DAVIN
MLRFLYDKLLKNTTGVIESTQLYYILQKKPSVNLKSFSRKVHSEISERENSVVSLFRTYGFTETEISGLISRRPELLSSYNPNKALKPKLEFFNSIGVSSSDLVKILSADPTVLERSLKNQIIPSYQFLKSILDTDASVIATIKRSSWVLRNDLRKYIDPNVALLRDHGVPESRISSYLKTQPRAFIQIPKRFRPIVEVVKEMGFDPSKNSFVNAILVLTGNSKSTWERKLEVYRKWGWSDDEILLAFKKRPDCMASSEKKINQVMDFLINKMGWNASYVSRCPMVVLSSLENWTIPRCLVVQLLLSKGLIKKGFSLSSMIEMPKKRFLSNFVTKYQIKFPELLNLYEGKAASVELATQSQGLDCIKNL